ncbi:MAG: FMN-binding negative transcriptional regulator [Halieaceae bacterium]
MYIPKHFEMNDKDEIFAFAEANAFGQLVSTVGGRLFSTYMPFLFSADKTTVFCHLAKQNPQHSELGGQELLITLEGLHGYVSPSWYSAPGVPTWNYQAVHIYGHAKTFTDPEKLKAVVDSLTEKHESAFDQPWQPDYKASMLGAIVGLEITISEVQCKYKLSQNRSSQDQAQVIEQLKSLGSNSLAEAMERNGL